MKITKRTLINNVGASVVAFKTRGMVKFRVLKVRVNLFIVHT